ncbi:hypothetical protein [Psychroserpens sp. SPM9]|uniref:hypothetical protein n=1 Tax=Psychroserpens sp. SPM9 TaxID=2975598 RepID=UPI0021A771B7|nr:hypothetical protein [Psychroserpens sp. SPM9]MDG5491150.1 hypothetical protein [Psychroserpens sp. SPM9]
MKSILLFLVLFTSSLGYAQTKDSIIKIDVKIISCFFGPKGYYNIEEHLKKKILAEASVKRFSKTDTLYFFLRKNDSVKIKDRNRVFHYIHPNKTINDTIRYYTFSFKNINQTGFIFKKYQDFDAMETDQKAQTLRKDLSFIEKHKDKIITIDFFLENLNKEKDYFLAMFYEVIMSKKIVYMIDEREFDKHKITLREISINQNLQW